LQHQLPEDGFCFFIITFRDKDVKILEEEKSHLGLTGVQGTKEAEERSHGLSREGLLIVYLTIFFRIFCFSSFQFLRDLYNVIQIRASLKTIEYAY